MASAGSSNLCIGNILLSNLICIFRFIDAHAGTVAAIATIVIAVFTIFLWWSTHKMWHTAQQSADAAKRTADALYATERAWVYPEVWIKDVNAEGSAYVIQTGLRITKYGKTPAVINGIKTLHSFEKPEIPDGPESEVFPKRFGPGILDKKPFNGTFPQWIKLQDWEDIEAFRKRLFLLIRVEYEDVFESTYTKDFWWVYKPIDRVWSIYRDQK